MEGIKIGTLEWRLVGGKGVAIVKRRGGRGAYKVHIGQAHFPSEG